MKRTSIGWTDFSSNPIKYRDRETGKVVWACVKAADECRNCYAETLALRWGKGHPFTRPNLAMVEPFLDHIEIRTLLRSPRIAGRKLFLGDMTDIFGSWVPDAWVDQIFAAFALRRDVTWQILTKRPKRLAEYTNDPRTPERIDAVLSGWSAAHGWCVDELDAWPPRNVIGGTSAGSQRTAELFVPDLLRANLAYRSVSVEPLIAAIDLTDIGSKRGTVPILHDALTGEYQSSVEKKSTATLDWVLVGGESGAGYRPMALEWLRKVVEDCRRAGVAVFVKQDAAHHPERRGRIPDDLWVREFPGMPPLAEAAS